jgi:formate dehydrogenase subunit gamma
MMQLASPAAFQDFTLEAATEVVEQFRGQPGALIVALHKLQETFGYVDEAAMPMLGRLFNLSRAEVHGVTSFYHDFRRQKPGRYTIKVCQAEACQAMGSERLTAAIKTQLGIGFHETTPDGLFTLDAVYCLGNCACSPAIMVDKQTYGRVTESSFKALTASLSAKAAGSK